MNDQNEFVDLKEAKQIFGGISTPTFDRMAQDDDFPNEYRFGSGSRPKRYFKRQELLDYRETKARAA